MHSSRPCSAAGSDSSKPGATSAWWSFCFGQFLQTPGFVFSFRKNFTFLAQQDQCMFQNFLPQTQHKIFQRFQRAKIVFWLRHVLNLRTHHCNLLTASSYMEEEPVCSSIRFLMMILIRLANKRSEFFLYVLSQVSSTFWIGKVRKELNWKAKLWLRNVKFFQNSCTMNFSKFLL